MSKPTREEAVATAGRVAAQMEAVAAQMTPRQLAEASWSPTSRYTVDELEAEIRADRGFPVARAS
jgi:Ser/Thr protein kinase RdoA (MazF antagonist)